MSSTQKQDNQNNQNIQKTNKSEVTQTRNNGMDAANAKALEIMTTKGTEAAVKHMFNPTGTRQLSYAEMRMRFG